MEQMQACISHLIVALNIRISSLIRSQSNKKSVGAFFFGVGGDRSKSGKQNVFIETYVKMCADYEFRL
jgi:hypothetical protein